MLMQLMTVLLSSLYTCMHAVFTMLSHIKCENENEPQAELNATYLSGSQFFPALVRCMFPDVLLPKLLDLMPRGCELLSL